MIRTIAFINPSLSTSNVGDLFIDDSVKRILLFDRENSVHIDPRKPITQREIDLINSRDAAVIAGTNLWYRSIRKEGRWMFTREDLKQIRVPIIPLGVGTTRHTGEDNGFDADTLAQLKLIHASCPAASARDLRTQECLAQAGITNVAMTGCPTLYRGLRPQWTLNRKTSRRVVVTVRKGAAANVHNLDRMLRDRGYETVAAAQMPKDNFVRRGIPLFRRPMQAIYEFDIQPYLQLVEECVGAIGWRLHGNMLHLAHGNPAVFFANCSRAQSFCEHFQLPCVANEDGVRLSPETLTDMIDTFFDAGAYNKFAPIYAATRKVMAGFLDANGLGHNLKM
ncbi:MAG: polysaccharide pyruvyl transferase family protein [Phycisphaerae bacterium]